MTENGEKGATVASNAAPVGGPAAGEEDLFLVFVDPVDDTREISFGEWFSGDHMTDMRHVAGVRFAHCFRLVSVDGEKAPTRFCALYEMGEGARALAEIARLKGTTALPQSAEQGAMTWRLFNTIRRPGAARIPARRALLLVLIGIPRSGLDEGTLAHYVDKLIACDAVYLRALRLSEIQPKRGSDFGVALLCAFENGGLGPIGLARELRELAFPSPIRMLGGIPLGKPAISA
jgi:hypothetical protein